MKLLEKVLNGMMWAFSIVIFIGAIMVMFLGFFNSDGVKDYLASLGSERISLIVSTSVAVVSGTFGATNLIKAFRFLTERPAGRTEGDAVYYFVLSVVGIVGCFISKMS